MSAKIADIRMAFAQYRQDQVASAKACVEEGGGKWVGIQECEGQLYDLVLFNATSGSTLALKTTEITPELVRERLQAHDEECRRMK
jgi:hypothetical protein